MYRGIRCGRSIWTDAVGTFGAEGGAVMRGRMAETGPARLRRLMAAVASGFSGCRGLGAGFRHRVTRRQP